MKKYFLIAALVFTVSGCDTMSSYSPWQRNVAVVPEAPPAGAVVTAAPGVPDEVIPPPAMPVPDVKRASLIDETAQQAEAPVVITSTTSPAAPAAAPAVAAAPAAPAHAAVADAAPLLAPAPGSFVPPDMHMHQCMPMQKPQHFAMMMQPSCMERETSAIDVSFQYGTSDVSKLSKEMDARVADIKAAAKKLGLGTVDLTELNYNVNNESRPDPFHRNDDAGYRVGGRMRFSVSPVDKAPALVQWLSGNNDYRVNLNTRVSSRPCMAAQ